MLLETKMTPFVDRVLVVDCSVATQIERVKKRDKSVTELIITIINSQVKRTYRLSKADDIIKNTASISHLTKHIKRLHNMYLKISKQAN